MWAYEAIYALWKVDVPHAVLPEPAHPSRLIHRFRHDERTITRVVRSHLWALLVVFYRFITTTVSYLPIIFNNVWVRLGIVFRMIVRYTRGRKIIRTNSSFWEYTRGWVW